MATAPAADQLTLLDVAELDSQIARLERSNVKHPLREKLGTIMNAAAARARDKEAAEKAVVSAEAHLAEGETKCMALQEQTVGLHNAVDSLVIGRGPSVRLCRAA